MDDSQSGTLDRMFNSVNEGVKWSMHHVKSACPWRKKKSKSDLTIPEGDTGSRTVITDEEESSKDSAGMDDDMYRRSSEPPSSHESRDYTPPSQICPPREPPCCYIKMQDPCRPCCCETKPPPCPDYSSHLDQPREPTCGCDLCKKGYPNDKCCDHREAFRRATSAPRYFEKA